RLRVPVHYAVFVVALICKQSGTGGPHAECSVFDNLAACANRIEEVSEMVERIAIARRRGINLIARLADGRRSRWILGAVFFYEFVLNRLREGVNVEARLFRPVLARQSDSATAERDDAVASDKAVARIFEGVRINRAINEI